MLDDIPSATEITIVTYNISERKDALVSALRSREQNCKVIVITNIPARWETYYGDLFRDKARNKIQLYMTKLNPEKLGIKSEVFFDFSNHGKIIMTNNVAYIGSANYSEESANNTEFGFILRDADFIQYLRQEILPEIKASAVPYYKYDYTELLLEANVVLSALFNIRNRLYEEAYHLHDDIDGEWYYYNEHEDFLSHQLLELIQKIVDSGVKVASDIYDAIDVITDSDDDEMLKANDSYEELGALSSRIEEILGWDTLYELADFNLEHYFNQQLQEEYAMEAYDENLQGCIDSISDEGSSIIYDLTTAAHDDIDELISEIDKFSKAFSDFIENLRRRQTKKVNPRIDNT